VPADFGIVTLATLAVTFSNVLRDLGLGGTLIVRQDLDRRAQGTALSLMLAMGVVVGGGLAAIAPLLADAFDEPRLDEVVAVLSVAVLLGGFAWFYETLMQRELEFRRRFVSLTVQSLSYAAVAIALAALGAGVWSLVAGQLTGYVVLSATLFALAPYRVRPRFDRGTASSLMSTGMGFMAQGGLAAVQQNVDFIAVGRVLGAGPVGLYSMAYRMSELPYVGIADPVAKVTFPSFARTLHEGGTVTADFLATLRYVALAACPLAILLSAAAEPFTRAILGENWVGMIGALSVLGIWGAVRPIQGTFGWLLNSAGEARLLAGLSAAVLIPLIPVLFLAADAGGIEAVAWVMLADMIVSLALTALFAKRRVGVGAGEQLRALGPVVMACGACWGATRSVAELTDSLAPGIGLVLSAGAGVVSYLGVLAAIDPGLLSRALRQVAAMLGRRPDAEPVEVPPE
jgi:lipopolysaccharide exporter